MTGRRGGGGPPSPRYEPLIDDCLARPFDLDREDASPALSWMRYARTMGPRPLVLLESLKAKRSCFYIVIVRYVCLEEALRSMGAHLSRWPAPRWPPMAV